MFKKLQDKWKVNGFNFFLIMVTFATGGSLCGYLGKKVMNLTGLDKGILWLVLYIIIVTILWPICVMLISIFTGQFTFFKSYISKMLSRFSRKKKQQPTIIKLAIFASGAGSNAKKIIEKFANHPHIKVSLIVCNKPGAGVIQIAQAAGIEVLTIEKANFESSDIYIKELKAAGIDWIILAGFLWKVPPAIIKEWPHRIINIHPALLPNYGGKGMYGQRVHEAVIAAAEKQSGISIHYVDEIYDNGKIIFQASCSVDENDNADSLAQKIHSLEHAHFANIIEQEIEKQKAS